MITTLNDATGTCDQYRECDGFCRRNCSCSGLSIGCNGAILNVARKEAKAAGLTRYNILSGKCGDWYIVPLDEMGRLI